MPQRTRTNIRERLDGIFTGLAVLLIASLAWGSVLGFVLMRKFTVPSTNNLPTLDAGDYVLTLPGEGVVGEMPWLGKLISGPPKRGDLSVFRKPDQPNIDYIKRVVGVPGDRVQMLAGVLHINDLAVPRRAMPDFAMQDFDGQPVTIKPFEETLPNGVTHATLDLESSALFDDTEVFTVPAGHYFTLGDNRDNSSDSRDPEGGVGFVPAENFIGKVVLVYFSTSRPWPRWVQ